jgi:hypothetical protein
MNPHEKTALISFAKFLGIIYAGFTALNLIRLIPDGILVKALGIDGSYKSDILEIFRSSQFEILAPASIVAAVVSLTAAISYKGAIKG